VTVEQESMIIQLSKTLSYELNRSITIKKCSQLSLFLSVMAVEIQAYLSPNFIWHFLKAF
jgi:hypothetical protein